MSTEPIDVRAMGFGEIEALTAELGQPLYRAEQLFRWVHGHGVTSTDAMTNLPAAFRARIRVGTLELDQVQTSRDGTRKIRLLTRDSRAIETVLIPDGDKLTQCISSQVGCAFDCQFCATAKLGLMRNLDAGEIVDQVYRAKALVARDAPGQRITNIVYMGMGEPLHNYDNVVRSIEILNHDLGVTLSLRRITVSTVGLVPGIEKLAQLYARPNLAISLNATTDEVRDQIMPVNRKWNIARLLGAVRAFPLEKRRRITFEYVLLAGVNDTLDDATRLAKLLEGFSCKVNLIPFNGHPAAPYRRPSPEAIDAFQQRVRACGLPAYLRTPRGDDIDAACGQLANRGGSQSAIQRR